MIITDWIIVVRTIVQVIQIIVVIAVVIVPAVVYPEIKPIAALVTEWAHAQIKAGDCEGCAIDACGRRC